MKSPFKLHSLPHLFKVIRRSKEPRRMHGALGLSNQPLPALLGVASSTGRPSSTHHRLGSREAMNHFYEANSIKLVVFIIGDGLVEMS
jgi:hypothetical protein